MKNSNIKTVVAVASAQPCSLFWGALSLSPAGAQHQHQSAVRGARSAGCHVRPCGRRPDRLHRPCLIDLSWGGIPWWSWVIASAFTGVVVGLFAKKLNVQEGDFNKRKVATFAIANVVAHAIAWIVVAPVLDILISPSPPKRSLHRRVCRCVQHHHGCRRRRPADSGLHQDHRQEGFSGQRVIRC